MDQGQPGLQCAAAFHRLPSRLQDARRSAHPASTLARARRIALDGGLRFVYTGNVHDIDGGTTFCPGCGAAVIVRDRYDIRRYELTGTGACRHCGTGLPGVFDGDAGTWGRRRLPVTPGQAAR